jgi:hypothetical protein
MSTFKNYQKIFQPVEPHKNILTQQSGILLYKIIDYNHFLDMLDYNYIYFSRVDKYKDIRDSDLPNKEREIYKYIKFENNPKVSLIDYYNSCRAKTYACCFSIKNSPYIWQEYGGNNAKKVCLVFDSNSLIKYLNKIMCSAKIQYNNKIISNFFYINYGLVKYGSLKEVIDQKPLNPIRYTFFKDKKYNKDNEFRISLSCNGAPKYKINGSEFIFPKSIKLSSFNFKEVFYSEIIKRIEISQDCDGIIQEDLKLRHYSYIPVR